MNEDADVRAFLKAWKTDRRSLATRALEARRPRRRSPLSLVPRPVVRCKEPVGRVTCGRIIVSDAGVCTRHVALRLVSARKAEEAAGRAAREAARREESFVDVVRRRVEALGSKLLSADASDSGMVTLVAERPGGVRVVFAVLPVSNAHALTLSGSTVIPGDVVGRLVHVKPHASRAPRRPFADAR